MILYHLAVKPRLKNLLLFPIPGPSATSALGKKEVRSDNISSCFNRMKADSRSFPFWPLKREFPHLGPIPQEFVAGERIFLRARP